MGKTYRKQVSSYDDEKKSGKAFSGQSKHSNNKKLGGMRIINDAFEDDDEDYFDDTVQTTDSIVINKNDGETS